MNDLTRDHDDEARRGKSWRCSRLASICAIALLALVAWPFALSRTLSAQPQPPALVRLVGVQPPATGAGGVVLHTVVLTNPATAAATLDITTTASSWPVHVPASVTVEANTRLTLTFVVDVPFEVSGSARSTVDVVLRQRGAANPLTARLASSTAGRATPAGYRGCRFDLDGSGVVDAADAVLVARAFGTAGDLGAAAPLDLDHSGHIGAADIQAIAGRPPAPCAPLPGADTGALRAAVTISNVQAHLERFQAIATESGGNRAALQPGYEASVNYVRGALQAAGYEVTVQTFTLSMFEQIEPSRLARLAPDPKVYTPTVEFSTFTNSGSGEVTATLQAVDLVLPPTSMAVTNTSGCQATDFDGFGAGRVALIQRGGCTFQDKVQNAQNAGAGGIIIFNEGQANRLGVVSSALAANSARIPVFGTSFALGKELAELDAASPGGVSMHLFAKVGVVPRPTFNVLADTATGDDERVIVVGGHLDSVNAGPGINDNGSGSATILETALQLARLGLKPHNTVRFAFWGAEERGLLGSTYYVDNLPQASREQIWMNLNFDMLGSPNFGRFIYDGDASASARAGPLGSDEIEAVMERFFERAALPSQPTAFDGRSDYGPFIAIGIPAGGLFTGAEGRKTAAEAALYGGTAGTAYDACYHQSCDRIDNISWPVLDEMADAVADIVWAYASDERTLLDRPRGAVLSGNVDRHYDLDYKGNDPLR